MVEIYEWTLARWHTYLEHSPVAPYTGYLVLGFLVFVLFCLWRRAATRATVAHRTTEKLLAVLGNPAKQYADTLVMIQHMHSQTLRLVQDSQSDTLSKMYALYNSSLTTIKSVVESFNSDD